ncbi:MAG: universal stress protein, partial [Dehalococcoidia bacterium]
EKGYKVTPLLLKGEPAEERLNAAETLNPELIVIGARGLTGIEAFFLGSVSQRVARFSKYSVLIVRKPVKES